ncbi:hypothetical protein CMK12_14870, partial [Candidatus Poribacteria bacterium]|nr:hypothetical protein [Candidatus Poribacteria bacterium]
MADHYRIDIESASFELIYRIPQDCSGPDTASVLPDSRKVLYRYVVPGAVVVDEKSAQAISV